MAVFVNANPNSDYVAIDGKIDGDTLQVGSVMAGNLCPGVWLSGVGYEDFVIERQIIRHPAHPSLGSFLVRFALDQG